MAYLLMDFVSKKTSTVTRGKFNLEIFDSLEEQFQRISRKLRNEGIEVASLNHFVSCCLPPVPSEIWCSMPGFDREITAPRGSYSGVQYLNNVVVRPTLSVSAKQVLPPHTQVIFIGDLSFRGERIALEVRGMELMDENIAQYGEQSMVCTPAIAVEKKVINGVAVPDFGMTNLQQCALTHDFVHTLCTTLFPVPDPQVALEEFNQWEHYLGFRETHLRNQTSCPCLLEKVEVRTALVVKVEDYMQDTALRFQVLDDIKPVEKKGSKVLLYPNKEWEEDNKEKYEEISLLTATIAISSKGATPPTASHPQNALQRGDTEEEQRQGLRFENARELYKFLRNPVELLQHGTEDRRDGVRVFLDDRYEIHSKEIIPDCSDLDRAYQTARQKEEETLKEKYTVLLRNTVTLQTQEAERQLKAQMEQDTKAYLRQKEEQCQEALSVAASTPLKKEYAIYVEQNRKTARIKLEKEWKENKTKEKGTRKQLEALELGKKVKKGTGTKEQLQEKLQNLQIRKEELERRKEKLEQGDEESVTTLEEFSAQWLAKAREEREKQDKEQQQPRLLKRAKELEQKHKIELLRLQKEEWATVKADLKQEFAVKRKERMDNDTHTLYFVHYKIPSEKREELKRQVEKNEMDALLIDNRAEATKVRRQKTALQSFQKGYVRNPYLTTYLLNPRSLHPAEPPSVEEMQWHLQRLNPLQKEAVCRAMASDSLFLLQGPPGTGKTQVIAEITAQMVKKGRKVLISSETHKAIDNVFDRLPKTPHIRTVRLMNAKSKKKSEYGVGELLGNFYGNVEAHLKKQVTQYEEFLDLRENFTQESEALFKQYETMLMLEGQYCGLMWEEQRLQEALKGTGNTLAKHRTTLQEVEESYKELDFQNHCYGQFLWDVLGNENEYYQECVACLGQFPLFQQDVNLLSTILSFSIAVAEEELEQLQGNAPAVMALEREKAEVKKQREQLRNPLTDEVEDKDKEAFQALGKVFATLSNELQELKESSTQISISSLTIATIVSTTHFMDCLEEVVPQLKGIQHALTDVVQQWTEKNHREKEALQEKQQQVEEAIRQLKLEQLTLQREIQEVQEDSGVVLYEKTRSHLMGAIRGIYHRLAITQEYEEGNIQQAVEIVKAELAQRAQSYGENAEKTKQDRMLQRSILKYAQQNPSPVEKKKFTKELFHNANVFGMTCTTANRFQNGQLQGSDEYGLGEFDIKNMGIDTVIIDEVSKSAFLDLLIPILCGKTVILVGDHRQLPPMYDLKHLRLEDFEGQEEDNYNFEVNQQYTERLETCYFKTLFEDIEDCYKVMLRNQYRCHSHIMDLFNHFYGGSQEGLTIGYPSQNEDKQHHLRISRKGRELIVPNKHIYFVDCTQKENTALGSTSIYNAQEADVVAQLIQDLEKACNSDGTKQGTLEKNLSTGVICMYGDQVTQVKRRLKNKKHPSLKKYKNLNKVEDEPLVISTVDDFQGDERDIIIVSMVRNPKHKGGSATFVKQFERINVAFSRARCLLVIVGSREFLSDSVIDLPDVSGNHANDRSNVPVYREIIETIAQKGRILLAEDVLTKEGHHD